jgi:hypothetical protein
MSLIVINSSESELLNPKCAVIYGSFPQNIGKTDHHMARPPKNENMPKLTVIHETVSIFQNVAL